MCLGVAEGRAHPYQEVWHLYGTELVGNIQCGGNDLRLGFYAAGWNSLDGDTIFVLCGDEDH